MGPNGEKIVRFDKYCKTCKYRELDEAEDPCHECLQTPVNTFSMKPIHYEEEYMEKDRKRRRDDSRGL